MNIRIPYPKTVLFSLLSGLMLYLLTGPLLPYIIDINMYQKQIIPIIEKSLKRKVKIGTIKYSWSLGPEFVVSDLHVNEKDSVKEFLSVRKISFSLRLIPLFQKKVRLGYVVVDGMKLDITRDSTGILNITDIIKPESKDETEILLRKLRFKNSRINWNDKASGGETVDLQISEIEFYIDQIRRGKKSKFALYAKIPGASTTGSIKLRGSVNIPKKSVIQADSIEFDTQLELDKIEYCNFWRYFGKHIPFDRPGGTIALDTEIKGKLSSLNAKGLVKLHNAKVVWPKVFHGPVTPSQASVHFDLKRTLSSIELSTVKLSVDGFTISGTARFTDLETKDPHLYAKAVTDPFEYKNVRSYIPFGIIEKDASDFIENKIKAGRFKLENGSIEGRFSKLAKFTEGDNANALYIRGTAENAAVRYGEKTPLFNQIEGIIELKGSNFNLQNMKGRFGISPFTMKGSITEYATSNKQSEYPFQMQITPRQPEVTWIAGVAGIDKLPFAGESVLNLAGEGAVKGYKLSGQWQLDKASYELPDSIVKKPSGTTNQLFFSALLKKNETRLTSMTYILPPVQLSATALLKHADTQPYFSFDLHTNQFMLNNELPALQFIRQYTPKGLIEAHIAGSGDPSSLISMHYSGNIHFAGFSAKLHEIIAPVSNINGTLTFKGNSVKTSDITAVIGKTPVSFRGHIAALKNPELELFVTSPTLTTSDFGLELEPTPKISNFSANLAYKNGLFNIRNINGKMNNSIFSAAGTVKPGVEPDINMRVAATYLDLHELVNLIHAPQPDSDSKKHSHGPQKPKKIHKFKLKGFISAESGSYRDLKFSRLSASLDNEGGLLQLRKLNAGLFSGKVTANGQLARVYNKPEQWNLSFKLDRVKSDELLHSLGMNRETTGLMTVEGNIKASGNTLDLLKKTATGNLSLNIERGVLRRFKSISKVISLLNISQILTLKIPDMSLEGMPFNNITATASIKDGLINSQDFFINSNAMNISAIGKADIPKETLDLLIGVQPLQAIDKVVSRIPVVGWILTGGDGSLVTTYFTAKGTWDDPQVSAIPVKSMASGTFDIFRRVFELPVRLFTDTGEVILGNQKERPKAPEQK